MMGNKTSLTGGSVMGKSAQTDRVKILWETVTSLVRSDARDLTARQLATFLICYLTTEEQTIRGLAAKLNVSKPAITGAVDRLVDSKLVTRKPDPRDKRSVLIGKTEPGARFLRNVKAIMEKASIAS
jgi:DNA-binding MarR family transcriptional regulator